MALLTNKDTEKNLNIRLDEFTKFGTVLKYMLDREYVDLKDLETMFFSSDMDKSVIAYTSVLEKMGTNNYYETSVNFCSKIFPNEGIDDNLYIDYLNKKCIYDILSDIKNSKKVDSTYYNTYSHLLNTDNYITRK